METLVILLPQVNLKRPGQWKNGNPSLIQMKPVSFQSPCVQRREVLSIETAPAPSKAWASREHRQFSPPNPQGFLRATRAAFTTNKMCPHKCLRSPSSGYSQKCNVSCVVLLWRERSLKTPTPEEEIQTLRKLPWQLLWEISTLQFHPETLKY